MLRKILKTLAALAVAALIVLTLLYNGVIWFTDIHLGAYPVRGVDVSNYQGEIDWQVLARAGYKFCVYQGHRGQLV